jgi:hypothetical protein
MAYELHELALAAGTSGPHMPHTHTKCMPRLWNLNENMSAHISATSPSTAGQRPVHCSGPGGGPPSSLGPGVLVGPRTPSRSRVPVPSAISHQMSSKEHMQLGWVVRRPSSVGCWVLSTPFPPGPPRGSRLGGAAVSCQYPPCSFLYSPHAFTTRAWPLWPSVFGSGPKPPSPSRSALAPVEPPPRAP